MSHHLCHSTVPISRATTQCYPHTDPPRYYRFESARAQPDTCVYIKRVCVCVFITYSNTLESIEMDMSCVCACVCVHVCMMTKSSEN